MSKTIIITVPKIGLGAVDDPIRPDFSSYVQTMNDEKIALGESPDETIETFYAKSMWQVVKETDIAFDVRITI